jgi:hypothetical protein
MMFLQSSTIVRCRPSASIFIPAALKLALIFTTRFKMEKSASNFFLKAQKLENNQL